MELYEFYTVLTDEIIDREFEQARYVAADINGDYLEFNIHVPEDTFNLVSIPYPPQTLVQAAASIYFGNFNWLSLVTEPWADFGPGRIFRIRFRKD